MSTPPLLPASLPTEPTGITIDSIVPAPESSTDVSTLSIELELKQAQLETAQLLNQELQDNILRRGNWGNRVFWLLLGWLFAVVAVLFLEGFHYHGFHLENSVLIAFIGSTTADVVGLGYIVANYLFAKHP